MTQLWQAVNRALTSLRLELPSSIVDAVTTIVHAARDEDQLRIHTLEVGIRMHRDARGDDRCWLDDEELYKILPESYTPPVRDTTVELSACERFILNRTNPDIIYVSPQRRIEELEDVVRNVQHAVNRLRAEMTPELLASLPEITRVGIDLALVHAQRTLVK